MSEVHSAFNLPLTWGNCGIFAMGSRPFCMGESAGAPRISDFSSAISEGATAGDRGRPAARRGG